MKFILSLSLILFLQIGCSNQLNKSYNYTPIENVKYEIPLTAFEHREKLDAVFLFFTCKIDNSSKETLFFNWGKISAKVNNNNSNHISYDSLASSIPETEKLNIGLSTFRLYFVLLNEIRTRGIQQFEITNFGILFEE